MGSGFAFVDKSGQSWVGTGRKGIGRLNTTTGKLTITDRTNMWNGFGFVDAKGQSWVGIVGIGFGRLNTTTGKITITDSTNVVQGFGFVDAQGQSWVGTSRNGIGRLNTTTGKITITDSTNVEDSFGFVDAKGQSWVGASSSGIGRLNTTTGKITITDNKSVFGGFVFIDAKGQWWVGTAGIGIGRLNTTTGKITITDSKRMGSGFGFVDAKGQSWVGTTYSGIGLLNTTTGKLTITDSTNVVQGFGFVDAQGQSWIGTSDSGIGRLNTIITKKQVYLDTTDGKHYYNNQEVKDNTNFNSIMETVAPLAKLPDPIVQAKRNIKITATDIQEQPNKTGNYVSLLGTGTTIAPSILHSKKVPYYTRYPDYDLHEYKAYDKRTGDNKLTVYITEKDLTTHNEIYNIYNSADYKHYADVFVVQDKANNKEKVYKIKDLDINIDYVNNKIAIGQYRDSTVYVYEKGNVTPYVITNTNNKNDFGKSVAILDDKLLVGSPLHESCYKYGFVNGAWSLITVKNGVDQNNKILTQLGGVNLTNGFAFKTANGDIYLGSNSSGIYKLNTKTKSLELAIKKNSSYPIQNAFGFEVITAGNSVLYIGTQSGLYLFDTANKVLIKKEIQNLQNGHFIATKNPNKYFISSPGAGLLVFDPVNITLTSTDTTGTGFFLEDDNDLYIALSQGIGQIDKSTGKITQITTKQISQGFFGFKDNNGKLIIGTTNGLAIFDPVAKTDTIVDANAKTLGSYWFTDGVGQIWVVKNKRLAKYDDVHNKIVEISTTYKSGQLDVSDSFGITDDDGNSWFGGVGSLYLMDKKNINYGHSVSLNQDTDAISKNGVIKINPFITNSEQFVFESSFMVYKNNNVINGLTFYGNWCGILVDGVVYMFKRSYDASTKKYVWNKHSSFSGPGKYNICTVSMYGNVLAFTGGGRGYDTHADIRIYNESTDQWEYSEYTHNNELYNACVYDGKVLLSYCGSNDAPSIYVRNYGSGYPWKIKEKIHYGRDSVVNCKMTNKHLIFIEFGCDMYDFLEHWGFLIDCSIKGYHFDENKNEFVFIQDFVTIHSGGNKRYENALNYTAYAFTDTDLALREDYKNNGSYITLYEFDNSNLKWVYKSSLKFNTSNDLAITNVCMEDDILAVSTGLRMTSGSAGSFSSSSKVKFVYIYKKIKGIWKEIQTIEEVEKTKGVTFMQLHKGILLYKLEDKNPAAYDNNIRVYRAKKEKYVSDISDISDIDIINDTLVSFSGKTGIYNTFDLLNTNIKSTEKINSAMLIPDTNLKGKATLENNILSVSAYNSTVIRSDIRDNTFVSMYRNELRDNTLKIADLLTTKDTQIRVGNSLLEFDMDKRNLRILKNIKQTYDYSTREEYKNDNYLIIGDKTKNSIEIDIIGNSNKFNNTGVNNFGDIVAISSDMAIASNKNKDVLTYYYCKNKQWSLLTTENNKGTPLFDDVLISSYVNQKQQKVNAVVLLKKGNADSTATVKEHIDGVNTGTNIFEVKVGRIQLYDTAFLQKNYLLLLDKKQDKLHVYDIDRDLKIQITTTDTKSVKNGFGYMDKNKNIWIGTENDGLTKLDINSGMLTVTDNTNTENGFAFNDNDKDLVATSSGLYELNPRSGKLKPLLKKSVSFSNGYGYKDSNSQWLATNRKGLSRLLSRQEETIKTDSSLMIDDKYGTQTHSKKASIALSNSDTLAIASRIQSMPENNDLLFIKNLNNESTVLNQSILNRYLYHIVGTTPIIKHELSPYGNYVCFGKSDGKISVYNKDKLHIELDISDLFGKYPYTVTDISFSSDEKYCVVGTSLEKVALFDIDQQISFIISSPSELINSLETLKLLPNDTAKHTVLTKIIEDDSQVPHSFFGAFVKFIPNRHQFIATAATTRDIFVYTYRDKSLQYELTQTINQINIPSSFDIRYEFLDDYMNIDIADNSAYMACGARKAANIYVYKLRKGLKPIVETPFCVFDNTYTANIKNKVIFGSNCDLYLNDIFNKTVSKYVLVLNKYKLKDQPTNTAEQQYNWLTEDLEDIDANKKVRNKNIESILQGNLIKVHAVNNIYEFYNVKLIEQDSTKTAYKYMHTGAKNNLRILVDNTNKTILIRNNKSKILIKDATKYVVSSSGGKVAVIFNSDPTNFIIFNDLTKLSTNVKKAVPMTLKTAFAENNLEDTKAKFIASGTNKTTTTPDKNITISVDSTNKVLTKGTLKLTLDNSHLFTDKIVSNKDGSVILAIVDENAENKSTTVTRATKKTPSKIKNNRYKIHPKHKRNDYSGNRIIIIKEVDVEQPTTPATYKKELHYQVTAIKNPNDLEIDLEGKYISVKTDDAVETYLLSSNGYAEIETFKTTIDPNVDTKKVVISEDNKVALYNLSKVDARVIQDVEISLVNKTVTIKNVKAVINLASGNYLNIVTYIKKYGTYYKEFNKEYLATTTEQQYIQLAKNSTYLLYTVNNDTLVSTPLDNTKDMQLLTVDPITNIKNKVVASENIEYIYFIKNDEEVHLRLLHSNVSTKVLSFTKDVNCSIDCSNDGLYLIVGVPSQKEVVHLDLLRGSITKIENPNLNNNGEDIYYSDYDYILSKSGTKYNLTRTTELNENTLPSHVDNVSDINKADTFIKKDKLVPQETYTYLYSKTLTASVVKNIPKTVAKIDDLERDSNVVDVGLSDPTKTAPTARASDIRDTEIVETAKKVSAKIKTTTSIYEI
jgi:streptogramin lyase